MYLTIFVSLFLSLFSISTAFAQNFDYHRDFKEILEASANKKSDLNYEKLLKRFNACDSTLTNKEILSLQIGFTTNKHYKPYELISGETGITNLVHEKKYTEAIKACDKILKTNPLNFTALMEKSFSLMKLKDNNASFHKEKIMKIIRCIKWSGDGTPEHPFFVLSPADGQIFIRYVLGCSIGTMGSGEDKNGYFLDILEMACDDKETKELHFIINHAIDSMDFKIPKEPYKKPNNEKK